MSTLLQETMFGPSHRPNRHPRNPGGAAAHVVADHHEQGWVLLSNGVVVLDDTSELWPDGTVVPPHRPEPPHRTAAL